jgi:hypothetical protein
MVIASNNKTSVMLGLLLCALGISVSSPADARKANRQGTYVEQGYPNPTPSITVMPRNTPKANIVCWTPCGQPGAIVMGADPDPVHSPADSARRERLFWWQQVGQSSPDHDVPTAAFAPAPSTCTAGNGRTPRSDLCWRWPSRLVATAEEDRLNTH